MGGGGGGGSGKVIGSVGQKYFILMANQFPTYASDDGEVMLMEQTKEATVACKARIDLDLQSFIATLHKTGTHRAIKHTESCLRFLEKRKKTYNKSQQIINDKQTFSTQSKTTKSYIRTSGKDR